MERNARDGERHLDASQSAQKSQIVDVSEVTDAKRAAGKLAKASAKRNIEMRERRRAKGVRVVSLGRQRRGQRRGIEIRIAAENFEPPGADRAARRFSVTVMAGEN